MILNGLDIESCDILIAIFWKRSGTPTMGARSGSELEIGKAIEAWKQSIERSPTGGQSSDDGVL